MRPPNRILAVDFGDRRTGLAATDATGTITVPLQPIVGHEDPDCAAAIADLVSERDTELVVVGLPLSTSGEVGPRAERTLRFVELLAARVSCRVTTFDERYTTDEAHDLLQQAGVKAARRKKLADSVAALIILKRFRGE